MTTHGEAVRIPRTKALTPGQFALAVLWLSSSVSNPWYRLRTSTSSSGISGPAATGPDDLRCTTWAALQNITRRRGDAMPPNLFDDHDGIFSVLADDKEQHSFPLAFAGGMDHVEQNWTDIRPKSLR